MAKKTVSINYTRLMVDLQKAETMPIPLNPDLVRINPSIRALNELFVQRRQLAKQINSGVLDHDVKTDAIAQFVQYNKSIVRMMGLTEIEIY